MNNTPCVADDSVDQYSTQPPTAYEIAELNLKDYGAAITNIANSLHVLEHALPLTRTKEIEVSFRMMKANIAELNLFLVARGFDV